ncbi:hypothetical protein [Fibrobacter sp. UWP2]|uniref:hypothetical protein n=1 Tax=Fibrobacter sp. UWP2 TaxID=1896216 RepID=UPI00091C4FF4|nr:hypothetical protein [Fibrobacter sp. UWP2]SHI35768.1 hypothetical protein SAMN05720471_101269 [Fibrobacter sp. UWP2]
MASKFEALYEEMKADTEPAETTTQVEDSPAPAVEDKPEEDPAPAVEDKPEDTPEDKPEDKPPEDKPAPIPEDKFQRAEFAFKRQLGRQKEKYEAELKNRDDKYDKLSQEFEELKKRIPEKKDELTRDKFGDDEDFIHALNQRDFEKFKEEWVAENKKKQEEAAEAARRQAEADRELADRQNAWLNNVNAAFAGDKARENTFLNKVQYATDKGFGNILDNCPVAADYLMNNPRGPVVLEHLLDNPDAFSRVFNDQMTSQLDIYYELRQLDSELRNAAPAETAPAKPKLPNLGKPGKQAGSGAAPDIWTDDKAMKAYIRSHR